MLSAILWFFGSAVFTDLAGYWLHRWAHRPSSPLFRAHMTHHQNYPPRMVISSDYRTSGSDSLIIWFAPFLIGYLVFLLLIPAIPFWAAALGAGLIAGASAIVHDLAHLSRSIVWRWRIFRGIAVRHYTHHFKMGRNFGILTEIWDRIFRTARPSSRSRRRPQLR